MKESITLFFSVFVGGFQAGDAVNEEIYIIVDERKALMERFLRNKKGEGSSWVDELVFRSRSSIEGQSPTQSLT